MSVYENILQSINISDEELEDLDNEIINLQDKLDCMISIRRIAFNALVNKHNDRIVLTKSTEPSSDNVYQKDRSDKRKAKREKIAKYLAVHGPQTVMQLVGALPVPQGSMTSLLNCDWFGREGGKVVLTTKGHQEVIADKGIPNPNPSDGEYYDDTGDKE